MQIFSVSANNERPANWAAYNNFDTAKREAILRLLAGGIEPGDDGVALDRVKILEFAQSSRLSDRDSCTQTAYTWKRRAEVYYNGGKVIIEEY